MNRNRYTHTRDDTTRHGTKALDTTDKYICIYRNVIPIADSMSNDCSASVSFVVLLCERVHILRLFATNSIIVLITMLKVRATRFWFSLLVHFVILNGLLMSFVAVIFDLVSVVEKNYTESYNQFDRRLQQSLSI